MHNRTVLLDEDVCYRALVARDARFDGRFIAGVVTTGIYCRPVCPARTPHRGNVVFFGSSGAAAAAGLRPCKRCRPDALPGSREWDGRADLVGRALRLIASGGYDDSGAAGLAAQLHVTPRHLNRELVASVGATAGQLARTRRAASARLLLEQTELPVADIAFAAGFGSVRQFNDVIRAQFGETASQLRGRRAAPGDSPGDSAGDAAAVGAGRRGEGQPLGTSADPGPQTVGSGGQGLQLSVRLPVREPYSRADVLDWLGRHAVAGVDDVDPARGTITTTLIDGTALLVALRPNTASVSLGLPAAVGLRAVPGLIERIRGWLDFSANPAVIDDQLSRLPELAPAVAMRPGLRVLGAVDPWRACVTTILGQQVSVSLAADRAARLCRVLGPGDRFPTAEAVGAASPDRLAPEVGIPRVRAAALVMAAGAVASGRVPLGPHCDRELAVERLAEIPGIGPWTLAEIRMRALGDPDVWAAGDLILRRGVGPDGAFAGMQPGAAAPWRSYAAHHVWAAGVSRQAGASRLSAAQSRRPADPGRVRAPGQGA